MRDKLLQLFTGLAFACITGGTALASNNKAMDADLHAIELRWEHIKFDEDGSPNFMRLSQVQKAGLLFGRRFPSP